MSEIKFTSDGKKVAVIGKINQSTFIVQEIFVSGENEIPSGEAFTVNSLHDTPVKSWKEKEVEKIEQNIKDARLKIEKFRREEESKHQKAIDELKSKTAYIRKVINNISLESFDMVTDYLLGNVKYVVFEKWTPELISFDEMDKKCSYDKSKIKLISLFGDDDGTLKFRLNQYSDGSGGSTEFTIHKTKESAVARMKEIISRLKPSDTSIPLAKEYGVEFDPKDLEEYKKNKIESIQKDIDRFDDSKSKYIEQLNDIKKL